MSADMIGLPLPPKAKKKGSRAAAGAAATTAMVIKFPKPTIRPNLEACRKALAICEDDPGKLLFLAFSGVRLVYDRVPVKGEGDPEQAAVDRLAISFFALAELLGVTDLAEALL